MERLYQIDIVFDGRTILETEYNAGLVIGFGALYVCAGSYRHYQIGVLLETTIPLADIAKRLSAVFPVGNRDMNRSYATPMHFLKNSPIPIAILEPVYDIGWFH